MEKYSVLMSVYYKDQPEYLKLSIDSMLNQTVKCDQFVIVKDGQLTKELDDILESYRNAAPELFTLVAMEKNSGLGRALDAGLNDCRNELVARMDSDDISLPERCEKQLMCFQQDPELAIVGTCINEFYDDITQVHSARVVPQLHQDIVRFARRRSPFNHPTVMYKKSDVIRCGGYGTTKRKEDLSLFPAMVNNQCKAFNIQEALLLYRSNKENLKRRKSWTNCKEYIQVIYGNYRKGYSRFFDVVYVAIAQVTFYLLPTAWAKNVSDKVLRKKPIEK